MAPRIPITTLSRTLLQSSRQQATTRQFSIIQKVRQAARNFEPHPFERYPTTTKAAPADWGRQFKRLGDAAVFYFPGFALVLGWPLIGEAIMDGRVT